MSRACGACGAPAPPPFQAPPSELAPDLDLRPGEPTRATLRRWMQTCRTCAAAAPDLAALPPQARAIIDTTAYRALAGPAAPFLRHAMLCDPHERAGTLLQAAWALDDAGEDAAPLRREAAALFGDTMQDQLCALDAWRRAGALDEAGALAATLLRRRDAEETDRLVIAYQQRLIEAADTARHLMSSALRPPAHRPHVSHNRAVKRGFWQRLAGR